MSIIKLKFKRRLQSKLPLLHLEKEGEISQRTRGNNSSSATMISSMFKRSNQ
jgi:hypothetical protein